MKIDRINNRNIELDRMERANQQYKREEDYRKVIEKKNIERIIAERVERNMRLDRDKGRYIDVDVWWLYLYYLYCGSNRGGIMGYEKKRWLEVI